MSEMGILALACIVAVPLTVSVVAHIFFRLLSHLEKTQVIGGTPKEIFHEQAAVGIEARKQRIEGRKPIPASKVLR